MRDTTMVIRRVCCIFLTVYLALILVVPLRLTRKMATISLVVVRARRFVASAVADHACLSTSIFDIVPNLAKFRVQAATRRKEMMPTMLQGMVVLVTVEAKPPGFSEGISAS